MFTAHLPWQIQLSTDCPVNILEQLHVMKMKIWYFFMMPNDFLLIINATNTHSYTYVCFSEEIHEQIVDFVVPSVSWQTDSHGICANLAAA